MAADHNPQPEPLPPPGHAGHDGDTGKSETEPPDMADTMTVRLAKLEVSVDGLRHSQNLTLGTVVGFGAIMVALLVYNFTRTDQLADRIAALPGQVASENRDIVKTLSDAITATKQQVPQVIMMA